MKNNRLIERVITEENALHDVALLVMGLLIVALPFAFILA